MVWCERLSAETLATADLLLTCWLADYPDTDNFIGLLPSEKGLIGRLCGAPEIDVLIEKGRTATNPEIRHETYRLVEEILVQHTVLLPLFHEQSYCFPRPELQGFEMSIFSPFIPYEKLWLRR